MRQIFFNTRVYTKQKINLTWPKIAKEIVATNPNENSPIKKTIATYTDKLLCASSATTATKKKNLQLPRVRYIHSKGIK